MQPHLMKTACCDPARTSTGHLGPGTTVCRLPACSCTSG